MTSKLKCPFCGETLRQSQYIEPLTGQNLYFCDTHDCYPTECVIGTQSMWQALIQAKQDLEIARQALREIRYCKSAGFDLPAQTPWEIIADKALKQIEHKE